MYQFIFFVFCISVATNFQAQKQELNWVGKSNRIVNPGAESNSSGAPLLWKTDYARGSESNWVSEYGVTSHEWNHGAVKAGLPTQPGANYFRLTVDKYNETRKLNIYQSIRIDDLHATLLVDTVMANFSCWIGSTYTTKTNCSFAEVKVIFKDGSGNPLDSIYIKKTPGEFRDLDAGTPEAEERGFNVMHEMKQFSLWHELPKKSKEALVFVYCEYPCEKFIEESEEESEGEHANTFFFDNFSLGFIKK
ncbi:MAG: hypothetical protein RLZZ198_2218 [Bacteroidota bacterium]|jgi:hypothetical protein